MEHAFLASLPSNQRVLVCPLHWGLGHATRCIPLIEALIQRNNTVVLASDGTALTLLQRQFPNLISEVLPGYDITYPYANIFLNLGLQSWKIRRIYAKEHRVIAALVDKHQIDIVFSDARYGCYSVKVPSHIITHQLYPHHRFRWFRWALFHVNNWYLRRFTSILVPDYEDYSCSLAKNLSHGAWKLPIPVRYMGTVSRFEKMDLPKEHLLVLLSGPEPQRTFLENTLLAILPAIENRNVIFVRGIYAEPMAAPSANIQILSNAFGETLQKLIAQATVVICRSGYTTLMDLEKMGSKAILIPTPGQTEQEYLATINHNARHWLSIEQEALNADSLRLAIEKLHA